MGLRFPKFVGVAVSLSVVPLALAVPVDAHVVNASGTCWRASDSSHFQSTSSTVYHSLSGDYLTAWNDGKTWWSSTYLAYHPQSTNIVYTVNSPTATWLAQTGKWNYTASFDATAWDMELNTARMYALTVAERAYVIAHELGHVWGLADVYDDSCAGTALMYASLKYVSSVRQADSNGFNYIWP